MPVLLKHFWIAFIVSTIANGAIWWSRGRPHRERDPSLTEGYRSLIRGLVTWTNLPWVIMGAGILFGGVPSIFHYFNPRSPNPFVSAFFLSVFFLWIAGTYWLFARGGAEKLVRHPGLIQPESLDSGAIKAVWLFCLAGGITAVIVMYAVGFEPPSV